MFSCTKLLLRDVKVIASDDDRNMTVKLIPRYALKLMKTSKTNYCPSPLAWLKSLVEDGSFLSVALYLRGLLS